MPHWPPLKAKKSPSWETVPPGCVQLKYFVWVTSLVAKGRFFLWGITLPLQLMASNSSTRQCHIGPHCRQKNPQIGKRCPPGLVQLKYFVWVTSRLTKGRNHSPTPTYGWPPILVLAPGNASHICPHCRQKHPNLGNMGKNLTQFCLGQPIKKNNILCELGELKNQIVAPGRQ